MHRWKKHFDEILNPEQTRPRNIIEKKDECLQIENEEIKIEKVTEMVELRLKWYKTCEKKFDLSTFSNLLQHPSLFFYLIIILRL